MGIFRRGRSLKGKQGKSIVNEVSCSPIGSTALWPPILQFFEKLSLVFAPPIPQASLFVIFVFLWGSEVATCLLSLSVWWVGLGTGLGDQGGASDVVLGATGHAAGSGGERELSHGRNATCRFDTCLRNRKRKEKRSFLDPVSFSLRGDEIAGKLPCSFPA